MDPAALPLKVDLHVHSAHSNQPYSWFLRSSKAAECYTPVDHVHAICKRRGMDLVTLADHDTIDGALELCARYPDDSFVSVEVSARFPDDGCIVHTIAVGVDEAQHRELQRLRGNVYELLGYMARHRIANFWCHPLSQVNGRLTRAHLEQCFLMFRAIEVRNGTRDVTHEHRLLDITSRLTPARLARWAERHPQVPFLNPDGRYAMVGGSDDHGSLAIARAYTSFRGEPSGAGVAAALRHGATAAAGDCGTGTTLAHNCYGVLAGYLAATGQVDAGPASNLADRPRASGTPAILHALVAARSAPVASAAVPGATMTERLWDVGHQSAAQALMRSVAERTLLDGWRAALTGLIEPLTRGHITAAADGLPALAKALVFELPYLLAHRYHVRDRRGADRFAGELGLRQVGKARPRVAVFTDTVDDVNGVALGLKRLLAESNRAGFELRVVGAAPGGTGVADADGVVRLPSVYEHRLAEYPDLAWSVPHLPALLRFLEDDDIDLVQCSTPGPVGLAALVAARLTGLPVIGQFHTDVPEYALRLTGDPTAAAMVAGLVGWFYRSVDRVLAPSAWVGERLRALGVPEANVVLVPRGIDLDRFRPALRAEAVFARWGIPAGPVLLYVGRLSREKALDHLLATFAAVRAEVPTAHLVMVGDGPLRAALERAAPPGCVFTGTVLGDQLPVLYASADVFVFPSETETFGNVVVEAQASGLPAVVAARGATRELIVDGGTGFAVEPRDHDAFGRALVRLLRDRPLRTRLGKAAVRHASRYDVADAVRGTFRVYGRLLAELAPQPQPVPDRRVVPLAQASP
ncbi:MAG: glycosyltransferase [Kofleriaceae bacterium]